MLAWCVWPSTSNVCLFFSTREEEILGVVRRGQEARRIDTITPKHEPLPRNLKAMLDSSSECGMLSGAVGDMVLAIYSNSRALQKERQ